MKMKMKDKIEKTKFTICELDIYATLSICCVVATSDEGKKSEMGMSAD